MLFLTSFSSFYLEIGHKISISVYESDVAVSEDARSIRLYQ